MKKTLVIIGFMAFMINSNASVYKTNKLESTALAYWFAAGVFTVPYTLNWYNPERNGNGLYISQGIDGRMITQGNIDSRTKLYYSHNRLEFSFIGEFFPEMKYSGLSIGTDILILDRKLSLLAGPEVSSIWNDNRWNATQFWSIGLNTEIRYLTAGRFSFSYTGNIKTRPDISKDFVYSGYISVNFRITK